MAGTGDKLYTVGSIVTLAACYFALFASGQMTDPRDVKALRAIRSKLKDPNKNLNWKNKDPCVDKWIGVICTNSDPHDAYVHVQELRLLNMDLFGTLSPELGKLSNLTILDFMWNNISGTIPKEIGNLASLQFLLLSGNQISGHLPDELGYLPSLVKFQLDLNNISGPIPVSFANLPSVKHFHMNNNSISGQIPPELAVLPRLEHILLDNNNLSGYLPPELNAMPSLKILQLDNNDFSGTVIPESYGNMSKLLKLSLRNCNLQGTIPDFSRIVRFLYLDLSKNKLTGSIPTNKLSSDITTINLSNNTLNGSIPLNFSGLPHLQNLSLANNLLSGSVPTGIWQNITFSTTGKLLLDFEHNLLSDVSGSLNPPENVTIKLEGNPVCSIGAQQNMVPFCGLNKNGNTEVPQSTNNSDVTCLHQSCPTSHNFEYVPSSPVKCFCAAPFGVGLRLRSPSILYFPPYTEQFISYMTKSLMLDPYQLHIDSIMWQRGPRLRMYLKFFPSYSNTSKTFNVSEIQRIAYMFASFAIPGNDYFGPYDLLNFTLEGPYSNVYLKTSKAGISKGLIVGIVLGTISCAITVFAVILVFLKWKHKQSQHKVSKYKKLAPLKMNTVKKFSFKELETATNSFSRNAQIGQGGYGKVYKSILANGAIVAVKRAHQGSLQGEKSFDTEIEVLSRVHHRNLVSLIGYCDEKSEQMLVYEFMPKGSLQDLLSDGETLDFKTRLHIALGASKGILYLHSEAYPPIYHRDIKANNILLDSRFTAKLSDFGISRVAPAPDKKGVATHISTGVKGTLGYVDPEYFATQKYTDKSDVYSLGVVFLELLTGMKPICHDKNIVEEVNEACRSGVMFSIVDRKMGRYPSECVKKFMALALRCSRYKMKGRPSMSEVVRELEDIYSMLPEHRIVPLELEESTSETSRSAMSSHYPTRKAYMSRGDSGSNLISGVIPIIRPL